MNSVFSVLMKRLNSLKTSLPIGRIASRDSFSTFMKLQSSKNMCTRKFQGFNLKTLVEDRFLLEIHALIASCYLVTSAKLRHGIVTAITRARNDLFVTN